MNRRRDATPTGKKSRGPRGSSLLGVGTGLEREVVLVERFVFGALVWLGRGCRCWWLGDWLSAVDFLNSDALWERGEEMPAVAGGDDARVEYDDSTGVGFASNESAKALLKADNCAGD